MSPELIVILSFVKPTITLVPNHWEIAMFYQYTKKDDQ